MLWTTHLQTENSIVTLYKIVNVLDYWRVFREMICTLEFDPPSSILQVGNGYVRSVLKTRGSADLPAKDDARKRPKTAGVSRSEAVAQRFYFTPQRRVKSAKLAQQRHSTSSTNYLRYRHRQNSNTTTTSSTDLFVYV